MQLSNALKVVIIGLACMTQAADAGPVSCETQNSTKPDSYDLANRIELLERFTTIAEDYNIKLQQAATDYHNALGNIKRMVKSCEDLNNVDEDLKVEFSEMVVVGQAQCMEIMDYADKFAIKYAKRLDEGVEFQRQIQRVSEKVKDQIDRVREVLLARQAVETGLCMLENS